MRRPNIIAKESVQIETVEDLTGVFESLASTQVAKVKHKVELSRDFFRLLWIRYSAIRFDPETQITASMNIAGGKQVFIVISAEAGLSGDIDQRLIQTMLRDYDPKTTDIVVLGTHGATQLNQRNIPFVHYFKVPDSDEYIDVSPVIEAIVDYSKVIVYYEEYVSLGVQDIKTIDLISSMRTIIEDVNNEDAIIPEETIFEPSIDEIANQMEFTMMSLALSEAILESSLAQAASRFNAMAVAKKRAGELLNDYRLEFHRAKRSDSDRQLREIMTSIKRRRRLA